MTIHRYDYRININDNQYKIQIDKNFLDITDLEDISRYGHVERRAFAEHIIFKFGVSSPCILDNSDCINPFAIELFRLFNGHMTCSFIVRDRVTTLCISGSLKYNQYSISETRTTTVSCRSLKYRLPILRVLEYFESHFKNQINPTLD